MPGNKPPLFQVHKQTRRLKGGVDGASIGFDPATSYVNGGRRAELCQVRQEAPLDSPRATGVQACIISYIG